MNIKEFIEKIKSNEIDIIAHTAKVIDESENNSWLEKNDFGWEWADVNNLDVAIKRSPISVAVYAWSVNELEEYVRLAASNHYTLNYCVDNFGRKLVFDSYENPILKTLAKDHNVEFAQMYTLKKKGIELEIKQYKAEGWWLWAIIKRFFKVFSS